LSSKNQRGRSSGGPIGVGDKAPDFTLPAQDGSPVHLADLLGERCVVLFFYPSDFTPVCTAEACAFRDQYEVFREAGAEVIGVSSDKEESHRDFARQNRLPFRLVSDPDGALRQLYGVPKVLLFLPGRTTYVIDRRGIVRHAFTAYLEAEGHVQKALEVVRTL
jgi:peroxiredoxin Q/BCP